MKNLIKIFICSIAFSPIIAIATTISHDTTTGAVSESTGTTHTFSHTITGTDPFLTVFCTGDSGNSDNISGVTYNSLSMVLGAKVQIPSGRYTYAYTLKAPTTGTHDVVITKTNNTLSTCYSSSYTGVSQTQDYDAIGTTTTTQYTYSISKNITTIASTTWVVGIVATTPSSFATLYSNSLTTRASSNYLSNISSSNSDLSVGTNGWSISNDVGSSMAMILLSFASSTPTINDEDMGTSTATTTTVVGALGTEEWLFIICIFLYFTSLWGWHVIFSPIRP